MDRRQELVIVDELPPYKQFDYARLGSFTTTTKEKRYALRNAVIDHEGSTDTVAKHFRDYVKSIEFAKRDTGIANVTYPYFAIPSKFPLARYYDIKSAYLQVASSFGGEVFIEEGRRVYYGDTLFDNPLFTTQRIARGLLVAGTAKLTSFEVWNGSNTDTLTVNNNQYAPHLRLAINHTLHAIISLIKRWIVYAMTDGFIVPSVYWDRVEAWLNVRNVDYSIKHEGPCEVVTRGTYKIGDHITGTYGMWPKKSVDYIIDDRALWWLSRFQRGKELHS